MKVEQSFEVAASPQRVWEALIDVERVTPCLPGAAVIARNDDGSFDGEFRVKIGPTSAAYSGRLHLAEVDEPSHTSTMQVAGTDKRGQGGAKATITSSVAPAGDGASRVQISSDYTITGRLARFGRGGMIEEISEALLAEFAHNLAELLTGEGEREASAPEPDAAPAPVAQEPPAPVEEPPAPVEDPPAPVEEPPAPVADEPPAVPPPADPDAVIEGAMPVADALAGEPMAAEEPMIAEPASPTGSTGDGPGSQSSPTGGGPVVVRRVKDNPVPFAALVVGFLVALRVLRRR